MIKFTDAEPAKSKEAARKAGDKHEAKPVPASGTAAPSEAAGVAGKPAAPKRKKSDAI
jgi:hypothetical protein